MGGGGEGRQIWAGQGVNTYTGMAVHSAGQTVGRRVCSSRHRSEGGRKKSGVEL